MSKQVSFTEYLKENNIPFRHDDKGGLIVEGDLDLSNKPIRKLPTSLVGVEGNFNLEGTKIEGLPSDFKYVSGDLNLKETSMTQLHLPREMPPENQGISESFFLYSLSVGGNVNIEGSGLERKSLESDYCNSIKINGDIIASDTPYYIKPSDVLELEDEMEC